MSLAAGSLHISVMTQVGETPLACQQSPFRKWFGHDPKKWAEFQGRYQAEIKEHEVALAPILQAARHGAVTLLYSSHDTEHNNAVVLRDYLQRKLASDRESKRGKSAA